MMYAILTPDISSISPTSAFTQSSSEERIRILEQEIFALRSGKKFDGVEINR
jgi:hypothetical protein